MSDKTFVDTNVLVYAHDIDNREKQDVARTVLRDLWRDGTGVLSPQVLQEFYVSVTRKIVKPLANDQARSIVDAYALWSVDVTAADIVAAFQIEDEAKINFWDALIVACAEKAGALRLLSADLNADQIIAGVRVENPFALLL